MVARRPAVSRSRNVLIGRPRSPSIFKACCTDAAGQCCVYAAGFLKTCCAGAHPIIFSSVSLYSCLAQNRFQGGQRQDATATKWARSATQLPDTMMSIPSPARSLFQKKTARNTRQRDGKAAIDGFVHRISSVWRRRGGFASNAGPSRMQVVFSPTYCACFKAHNEPIVAPAKIRCR